MTSPKNWPEKPLFWREVLVQGQSFGTGTKYGLEILNPCSKRVKTKSLKVFGANSNICRGYRKKNGREGELFGSPIQNKVNRGEQLQYFLRVTTLLRPSNCICNNSKLLANILLCSDSSQYTIISQSLVNAENFYFKDRPWYFN